MDYTVTEKVSDGYIYKFYGDIEHQDEMIAYGKMSKNFMNRPFASPLDIVGNYDWHQEFPYEKHLGFNKFPAAAHVLDWGCGPGRMVERARKIFHIVDGVDVSEYAVRYARENFIGSHFYVSSGVDVGDAPTNYYDLIFSTIAMQHIPVRTIRKNILRGMSNLLRENGQISLQVAYAENQQAGVWSHDTEHASYDSDFFNAKATNGHADMVINKESLPLFITDLGAIFDDVTYDLVDVKSSYANLNGRYHAPYWADAWLFVHGKKK